MAFISAIYAAQNAHGTRKMAVYAALLHIVRKILLHTFRCTPLWTSSTSLKTKEIQTCAPVLTLFLRGVKPHSFFDITEVFPVGGESGAQVSSPQSGSGWKSPVPTTRVGDAGMYR
jgi:hypothetical protein